MCRYSPRLIGKAVYNVNLSQVMHSPTIIAALILLLVNSTLSDEVPFYTTLTKILNNYITFIAMQQFFESSYKNYFVY